MLDGARLLLDGYIFAVRQQTVHGKRRLSPSNCEGRVTLHSGHRLFIPQVTAVPPTAAQPVRAGVTVLGLDAEGKDVRLSGIDEIVCATGQRPDLGITSELRLKLDPWLESTEALGPLIDPNIHSCGTVRPHGQRELSHRNQAFTRWASRVTVARQPS